MAEPLDLRRKARIDFWVYFLSIIGLAVLAVTALAEGDARRAGLAGLAGGGLLAGVTASVICAVPAALLGEWLIAGVALAGILASTLRGMLVTLPRRRSDDHAALARALTALPDDLFYALRIRAGATPVTTWHLVAGAQRARPDRWDPVLGGDPREGAWDGPVIDLGDGRRATLFAAEAAGLSAVLAMRFDRPVDADLLALAACTIPLSAGDEWVTNVEQAVETVLGAPLIEVIECITKFTGTAAGRDIIRRARLGIWSQRLGLDDREFAYEFRFSRLPRLVWQAFSS